MVVALTDAGHITEFYAGFTGTCGECAAEVAKAAARGQKANLDDMVALTHEMQQHGEAAPNGASTIAGLADELRRQGLVLPLVWDYAEPFQHDVHALLLEHAGTNPVILELANGQALRDAETADHDEVGLHYHYIVILGKQPDGYVANDGDNPDVTKRLQVYSIGTLQAAQVCGVIVVQTDQTQGVPMAGVPTGWHDDGTTLTAPNGVPVVHGFRSFILSHDWDPHAEPIGPEYPITAHPAGSQQDFAVSLRWIADPNYTGTIGGTAAVLANMQQQLAQALAKVANLTTQLATAKQQPPTVADPEAEKLASDLADIAATLTKKQAGA